MSRKRRGTPIKKSRSRTRKDTDKLKKITNIIQSVSQEERLEESKKDFNLSKIVNESLKSSDSESANDNVCLYVGGMYDAYPLLIFPQMSSWIYTDEFPMNNEVAQKFGNTYDEQIRNFLSEVTKYFKVAGYMFKEHLSENNLVMYESSKDPKNFIMYFYSTKFPESCATSSLFAESLQTVNTLYLSSENPHETLLSKVSYPLHIIATCDSLVFNPEYTPKTITNFLYHHYVKDIKYSIIKSPSRTYTPENIHSEAKSCTLVQCFNLLDMHYQSLDPEKLEVAREQEPTYYYTKANRVYTTGTEINFNPEYEEPEPVNENHNEDSDNEDTDREDTDREDDNEDIPIQKFTLSEDELEERYQEDHDTKKRIWDKLLINKSAGDSSDSKTILSSLGIKIKKNKNDNIDHGIIDAIETLQISKEKRRAKKETTVSSATLQIGDEVDKDGTQRGEAPNPELKTDYEVSEARSADKPPTGPVRSRMSRKTKSSLTGCFGSDVSRPECVISVNPYSRKKRQY